MEIKWATYLYWGSKRWTYKVDVYSVDYYRYSIDHFVYETEIVKIVRQFSEWN